MKKIVFVIILLLTAMFLSSCAGVVENMNFETDGYVIVDGEKIVPEYVIKINDNPISLAEYRYYYLNQKRELDGGDNKVWKDYPEYTDSLRTYVESTLTEVYAIRDLAFENGVEPDYKKVNEQIDEYKEGMSSSDFKKGLKEYHLTKELYEYILQGYELYSSLFDYYFGQNGTKSMSEGELMEYVEENYTHAKHILIYPNTTMSDEDYEKHLSDVLAKAKSGEDFDALIKEFSNDTAMPSIGYYFTKDEMPEEFVDACDSLSEGEISDLVKSSHGYHIIQKLPVDPDDIQSLTDVVYNEIFSQIIDEKILNSQIEYCDEYEYITPTAVK